MISPLPGGGPEADQQPGRAVTPDDVLRLRRITDGAGGPEGP